MILRKLCSRTQFIDRHMWPIVRFIWTPSNIKYEQGQSPDDHKIREYFYYIDHQGYVSLRM